MGDNRLAELLEESKLVTDAQLKTAQETQKQVPGDLGAILTKLRFITEEKLAAFLGQELNLPVLKLAELVVSPQVSALIDVEVLEKHLAVPIRKDGETLVLAVANPMDDNAIDEIRFLTGLPTRMAVATRTNIQKAINYYFHGEACQELKAAEGPDRGRAQGRAGEAAARATQVAPTALLQALVELLIEKKVIAREELVARVGKNK